jgi:hypothetical protein
VFDITLADGRKRHLEVKPIGSRFFLKGGLYGGLDGWVHGDDKGKLHVEHSIWDLKNPYHRAIARQFSDEVCEFREGGEVGYGTFQYWVTKGYPVYTEIQHLPAP